eukprot:2836290-Pyramimonas_sp.AAC.1
MVPLDKAPPPAPLPGATKVPSYLAPGDKRFSLGQKSARPWRDLRFASGLKFAEGTWLNDAIRA